MQSPDEVQCVALDTPYTNEQNTHLLRRTNLRSAHVMTNYPSDPRKHTAETAETMADVRYEVDRIDRVLVSILAERQSFMDAAARIKPHRGVVKDRWRIEDVISKVLAECENQGLSKAIAEPVWRTLIDRCIAYEFGSYDSLKSPETDIS